MTAYVNFAYFHRRRICVTAFFLSCYTCTCAKAVRWDSDLLRMGVAGSLAITTVECLFHVIDTVNIRAKAQTQSISFASMVHKIYSKEGMHGFGKGFSACFYGATVGGFLYFCAYKTLKPKLKEILPASWDIGLVFALAGMCSETLTVLYYYPFNLIKCRLQSVNYIFKYQNLPHAFGKEIRLNGVRSLYDGVAPFILTYGIYIGL
jgi:hypothetical protein